MEPPPRGRRQGAPPAPRTTVCSQHVIKETMCRICLKFKLDNLEKIQDPDNILILKLLLASAEMLKPCSFSFSTPSRVSARRTVLFWGL